MANEITEIRTLEELTHKKQMLKAKIDEQDVQIKKMWKELFHDHSKESLSTPSARLAKVITVGSSVFDGALLGWKLYRKFKR